MTTTTQRSAYRLLQQLETCRATVISLTKLEPVLRAAVEGKTIQVLGSGSWHDDDTLSLTGAPETYRVKPEVQTVKSRRYLYRLGNPGRACVGSAVQGVTLDPTSIQILNDFIAWIDDDWVTHEVPEVAK